jgi:hypothetical protein
MRKREKEGILAVHYTFHRSMLQVTLRERICLRNNTRPLKNNNVLQEENNSTTVKTT